MRDFRPPGPYFRLKARLSGLLRMALSGAYAAVTLVRRYMYDIGLLREVGVPARIVSIGGLEAGGSGKTPVARLVLGLLGDLEQSAALISRGYGRDSRGLVVWQPGDPIEPSILGDEPAMILHGGAAVPTAICSKRLRAAKALLDAFPIDTLVLDDGFAHRALRRDLDVVVLRGEAPFGSLARLLPWGSLREPSSSLRRANVVWLHFKNSRWNGQLPEWTEAVCPDAHVVVSEARLGAVVDLAGRSVELGGARVVVAAGIAHPTSFQTTVEDLGAEVVAMQGFEDHCNYTHQHVSLLREMQDRAGAEAVVVTEKDAVKLRSLWADDSLVVVGTEVDIIYGEATLHRLLRGSEERLVG